MQELEYRGKKIGRSNAKAAIKLIAAFGVFPLDRLQKTSTC
jgi:hypothetical protein